MSASKTKAASFYAHVGNIVEAWRTGQTIPGDTLNYLKNVEDRLYRKMARAGLVEPREAHTKNSAPVKKPALLGEFLDEYLQKRTDVAQSTKTFYGHTTRNLLAYFGLRSHWHRLLKVMSMISVGF